MKEYRRKPDVHSNRCKINNKIQHPSMIKKKKTTSQLTKNRRKLPHFKGISKESTVLIMLYSKTLKTRQIYSLSTLVFNILHGTGGPTQCHVEGKRNERHKNPKGRSKTVYMQRTWLFILPRESNKVLLQLITEINKVTGYSVNIKKINCVYIFI